MPIQVVLLPLFVQVMLTFGIGFVMAYRRYLDFRAGVRPDSVALREPNWSPRTLQAAYSFSNQFELPVLFYVLTILAIITRHADFLFLILSWLFVFTRIVHAAVHITSNVLKLRGAIFGVGAVILFVMWVIFIVEILLGLP